ncbi:MAG: HNH endonuclease [candidate division SR1 bacterium]|nr:HNH endonuclease [candidate division SR1 bacterium]
MNLRNIPSWLETEVRNRDTHCIYCGIKFNKILKKNTATWEHIINDGTIITKENIALCCFSCNASKGAKNLSIRLNSNYCKEKNITSENIALIAKQALIKPPTKI